VHLSPATPRVCLLLCSRPGYLQRVAKAFLDQTAGYRQSTASVLGQALFHEPLLEEACSGMVLVRDIDFAALSEDRYGVIGIKVVMPKGVNTKLEYVYVPQADDCC
jgi:hypothetical protein